jgi:tRNA pseudouridine32 synthase/23S rRNA pseudouridine746 synthase
LLIVKVFFKHFLTLGFMQILFQDKHMLVVNKPSGLLSQPGSLDDSVVHRLQGKYPFVGQVHRLDQYTSGIMVFGLNKKAQSKLSIQFQDRQTFKVYEAVVYGRLPCPQGHIDLPLQCDWPNRPRQEVNTDGKQALTHWQKIACYEQQVNTSFETLDNQNNSNKELENFPDRFVFPYNQDHFNKTSTVSRVLLIPHTGRSHQLRVHMSAIGHPIIGDYFYAHNVAFSMANRLNLHARSLYLNHPFTGQRMQFESHAPF